MMALYGSALTDDALARQKDFLVATICPFVPDSDGCSSGVFAWWDIIAQELFNEEWAGKVCQGLDGSCSLEKAWDCEACAFEIVRASMLYSNKDFQAAISEDLSGDCFCTSPDLDLNDEQVAYCQQMMTTFLPAALTALANQVATTAYENCNATFGLC